MSGESNCTLYDPSDASQKFIFYCTPVIVILGFVGNGVSVYVFFATKLRKSSSSYYLAALAISDNLFLLSVLFVWLPMIEVDFYNKPGMCQVITYLSGTCSFLSVWLVFAFTVERFVAVRYPLLRQSVCTVSRAKNTVVVLVALSMILYFPHTVLATVRPTMNNCTMCTFDSQWQQFLNLFNYIDTFITFIAPVVVITVLNICISRTIWKLSSVRSRLTHRTPAALLQMRRIQFPRSSRQRKNATTQNKITKMLLVVSTVCLCLHLPSYVVRIIADLIVLEIVRDINPEILIPIQLYCQQLFYMSFGINFFLYCISGQNFRKALTSLHCARKQLRRLETAALTESKATQSSVLSNTSRRRRPPNLGETTEAVSTTSKKSTVLTEEETKG